MLDVKKFVLMAICALGLTAASKQEAAAWNPIRVGINIGCCNYGITVGCDCSCNPCGGPCGPGGGYCLPCSTGPWYGYFPSACPPCAFPPANNFPYTPAAFPGGGFGGH